MSVDCSMLQCRLVLNLMLPSSESRILCFKLAILLQWQSISFVVVRRKKFYLFSHYYLTAIWTDLTRFAVLCPTLGQNSNFVQKFVFFMFRDLLFSSSLWKMAFLSFFKKACGLKSSFANVDKSWHSISAAKLGRRTTASSIPFQTKTDL